MDTNDVNCVLRELRNVYPQTKIKHSISLPLNAFNTDRGRYRADSLIKILSASAKENEIIIGLTGMDISTTKGSINDWGIMGLGFCPGKACVASTFRLSPQYRRSQLVKVAIHELGHTQGLPHCKIKTCLMRDAEGGNHLNEEKEFCRQCRSVLIKKGWQLNDSKIPLL